MRATKNINTGKEILERRTSNEKLGGIFDCDKRS